MKKEEWLKKGYVDEPVEEGIDLKAEISRLKKEKNAVVLGHYYQADEIQEIADFIGDSLALAQWAAKTDASIIVMCGVHFMGETAKILCPDKKVLIPDLNAGCSLADSCPDDKFARFIEEHPGHTVISYVNTSAAVKALTDVVVTSTNAKQIVESFPEDQKIIFGPDKNLGNYINSITGRSMLLWDGACHVHEKFSVEKILQLKEQYPDADVLVHPECKGAVAKLADKVASTAGLLKHAMASSKKDFIVATESGILFEMRKKCPQKNFIPVPPEDSTCACNECNFMRLNTLKKLYNTLKYEWPEVVVDKDIAQKAVCPIRRMLEISEKLGL
ncbi:quinolinate synthase NadA [Bacteroides caecicola]|uniref:quinolinate synthase NadA n=1 Tax=Bacteroides caecicola TaxID=1462569 RepID=UPI002013B261|nr:quinolinate synthase NadA [Bacteroides caecicola]MCL1626353.1 quinolinate synthase NadA [Bacteroides caecicola]